MRRNFTFNLLLGSRQLQREFPGVYTWNSCKLGDESIELSGAGAAIQLGVVVLAQEYILGWDCLQTWPPIGRLGDHLARLRSFLQGDNQC